MPFEAPVLLLSSERCVVRGIPPDDFITQPLPTRILLSLDMKPSPKAKTWPEVMAPFGSNQVFCVVLTPKTYASCHSYPLLSKAWTTRGLLVGMQAKRSSKNRKGDGRSCWKAAAGADVPALSSAVPPVWIAACLPVIFPVGLC